MQRYLRAPFVGALVAAFATLPGLGVGTLWDNSETAYGEVAREILLTHDWVVMHLNAAPWFVQPPLYFWLAALCAKVFGVSTLAMRLPAALATIAMGAFIGSSIARHIGSRVGIYASVVLSTCLMQAVMGRLAIMDALLDLFVMLSIMLWFEALESGSTRLFVLGAIAAGFGFLAKGPVAPVLDLLVIVPYALWNQRIEEIRLPSIRALTLSVLGFLVVIAPWMIALGVRVGPSALVTLIGHYTIGRYTGVIENQAGPMWYYLPVIVLGFFPWVAFLPSAAVFAWRSLQRFSGARGRVLRLGIVWAILPLVFFSFARTKLPNYIALEFPAFALLVALYFDEVVERGSRRAAWLSAAAVPLAIACAAIGVMIFAQSNRITDEAVLVSRDLIAFGGTIFVGAVVTAVCFARRSWQGIAPYGLGLATMLAMDVLAIFALGHAERFKPVPVLASVIDAHLRPGDVVAIQGISGGNALMFYARPPIAMLAGPDEIAKGENVDPRATICHSSRSWVITSVKRPNPDPTYGRTRTIVAQNGRALLFLYDGPACR